MHILKENATYVIANYIYQHISNFINDFSNSEKIKDCNYKINKTNIEIATPLPPGLIESFDLPIVGYKIEEDINLAYTCFDRRLDMYTEKYSNAKSILDNLLYHLAMFKITDNISIGINYSAECCTDNKRLSIFNTSINDETITNWNSNMGFKISIPMRLNELGCVATYSITKLKGGLIADTKEVEPYVYNISVNYNYNFNYDKADIQKRLESLKNLIENTQNLYEDFYKKCEEITALC